MASVTEINSAANSLVYLEASLVKISLCRTRSFSLALLKLPDFAFACAISQPPQSETRRALPCPRVPVRPCVSAYIGHKLDLFRGFFDPRAGLPRRVFSFHHAQPVTFLNSLMGAGHVLVIQPSLGSARPASRLQELLHRDRHLIVFGKTSAQLVGDIHGHIARTSPPLY